MRCPNWTTEKSNLDKSEAQSVPFDKLRAGSAVGVLHEVRQRRSFGCLYPVVTSWVSMEHWLQGSQVSNARPGAPIAFFRDAHYVCSSFRLEGLQGSPSHVEYDVDAVAEVRTVHVPSLRDSFTYLCYPALPCRATGCSVPSGLAGWHFRSHAFGA
jgi:hypothetical protein